MQNGTLIGPYRIDGLLGSGGMAAVYKAWHTGLHRHEALKVPHVQQSSLDETFVPRFLNEARVAAGLYHPHIATIYSVSEENAPQPYFSMEWIEGRNLDELLVQSGRLPLEEALAILEQVSGALDHAHEKGVVHRDIKPGNILLQRSTTPGHLWNVKVVDFGIARASEDSGGKRLTKAGMIVGTPDYMSPEQGGSGLPVDHRTDIYSLGIVAYEMLCGHTPFTTAPNASALAVLWKHVEEAPRSLLDIVPGLPPAVNDAVLWALAKKPDDRPATCAAWIAAMRPAPATTIAPTPFAAAQPLPHPASNSTDGSPVHRSASGAPAPLTRTPSSPAQITQPQAGQAYDTQVQSWPQQTPARQTSASLAPSGAPTLPQGVAQATLVSVPQSGNPTMVETVGGPPATLVAQDTAFSNAALPASSLTPTVTDVAAPTVIVPDVTAPHQAAPGHFTPGAFPPGTPSGTPWPGPSRQTAGAGAGGSEKTKMLAALVGGSVLLLAGFLAIRSAQTPNPPVTNPTAQPTVVMPTTAPSPLPSATAVSSPPHLGAPPRDQQPPKDAGNQAQAEIAAKQARDLINAVVSNMMRVRKLKQSRMINDSEMRTEQSKSITELRQAYNYARDALKLDDHNMIAHVQIVRSLYYLAQYGPAQSACNTALELFPTNADLLALRQKIKANLAKR